MANTSKIIRLIICTVCAVGFMTLSGITLANIQELPSKKFISLDSHINSHINSNINTHLNTHFNTKDKPNNFFSPSEKTMLTASLFTARKQAQASSAAEAAQIAKQRHGGKVLSVDTKKTSNGVVYRVKLLLDNGRVKTVTVSGQA